MSDAMSFMRAGTSFNVGYLPMVTKSSVCAVELLPGMPVPHETHSYDERVVILDGGGTFTFGEAHPYEPGDMFLVPAGVAHWFEVTSRTVFLRLVTR